MKALKLNQQGLIYLDRPVLNALFDCVYGAFPVDAEGIAVIDHTVVDAYLSEQLGLRTTTKKLLRYSRFQQLMRELQMRQQFNVWYRHEECAALFDVFEQSMGPMERNSDGTTFYLGLGLAIKEYYGLRSQTLCNLLKKVTVRK